MLTDASLLSSSGDAQQSSRGRSLPTFIQLSNPFHIHVFPGVRPPFNHIFKEYIIRSQLRLCKASAGYISEYLFHVFLHLHKSIKRCFRGRPHAGENRAGVSRANVVPTSRRGGPSLEENFAKFWCRTCGSTQRRSKRRGCWGRSRLHRDCRWKQKKKRVSGPAEIILQDDETC